MIQYPNVVDGCFLRYEEEHPSFRPYTGLIMHAAGPVPDADQVRAQVAARIERMPTLAWRVLKRGGRTVWELDPHFDPHTHVHEVRLDESTSLDEAIDDLLCLPMPKQSPRWAIWLIHGYSDDEYVLFYRSHHAAQDGQAMMDTLTALFGTQKWITPPAATSAPADRRPWWQRIPVRAALQNLKEQVEALRPTLAWSPQRPPTGKARVQSASVPMGWLRETGKALGASSNDICLAALAHAMRQWMPEQWIAPGQRGRDLHVCLPVSLREPEERFMVGNRLSAARIPLSFWEDSTPARVTAISRATAPAKTEETRRVLRAQLRLPEWLVYRILQQSTGSRNGLDVTGLVRLPEQLAIGSDPIDKVVVAQFLHDDHVMGVAFLAYEDKCVVSVTADHALDDAGNLAFMWASAVKDMWQHHTAASSHETTQVPQTLT
ncbi:wax ester/triacylglycerol synthase domain-containing protein [Streptomyces canus]|uniref:wax ester/triacylglycerol synthase domain-containing protein n=1 Tax=Streptomyces canus TaxID=58343 RepID=UPI003255A191